MNSAMSEIDVVKLFAPSHQGTPVDTSVQVVSPAAQPDYPALRKILEGDRGWCGHIYKW